MTTTEQFTQAYIEAIYFTETGDVDQPAHNAQLTPYYKAKSWIECRNFFWAYGAILKGVGVDPDQAGHDLWLTRNGHGAGFWDRPDVYGEALAQELTRVAKSMGSSDAEFEGAEIEIDNADSDAVTN